MNKIQIGMFAVVAVVLILQNVTAMKTIIIIPYFIQNTTTNTISINYLYQNLTSNNINQNFSNTTQIIINGLVLKNVTETTNSIITGNAISSKTINVTAPNFPKINAVINAVNGGTQIIYPSYNLTIKQPAKVNYTLNITPNMSKKVSKINPITGINFTVNVAGFSTNQTNKTYNLSSSLTTNQILRLNTLGITINIAKDNNNETFKNYNITPSFVSNEVLSLPQLGINVTAYRAKLAFKRIFNIFNLTNYTNQTFGISIGFNQTNSTAFYTNLVNNYPLINTLYLKTHGKTCRALLTYNGTILSNDTQYFNSTSNSIETISEPVITSNSLYTSSICLDSLPQEIDSALIASKNLSGGLTQAISTINSYQGDRLSRANATIINEERQANGWQAANNANYSLVGALRNGSITAQNTGQLFVNLVVGFGIVALIIVVSVTAAYLIFTLKGKKRMLDMHTQR